VLGPRGSGQDPHPPTPNHETNSVRYSMESASEVPRSGALSSLRLVYPSSFHLAKTLRIQVPGRRHSYRPPLPLQAIKYASKTTTQPFSRQSNTTSPNTPSFPLCMFLPRSLVVESRSRSPFPFYIATGQSTPSTFPFSTSRRTKHYVARALTSRP